MILIHFRSFNWHFNQNQSKLIKIHQNESESINFIQKLVDFIRILTLFFNQSPILTLKSESSYIGCTNLLESDFEQLTIQFVSPNPLSLECELTVKSSSTQFYSKCSTQKNIFFLLRRIKSVNFGCHSSIATYGSLQIMKSLEHFIKTLLI